MSKSPVYRLWPLEIVESVSIKHLNQSTGNKQLLFICISFSENIQYLHIPWSLLLEKVVQTCGIKGGRWMCSELPFYSNYVPWDLTRRNEFKKNATEKTDE